MKQLNLETTGAMKVEAWPTSKADRSSCEFAVELLSWSWVFKENIKKRNNSLFIKFFE